MEYREFLQRLFSNKSNKCNILIHQLPLQRSNFFNDPQAAADFIDTLKNGPQNIYTTGGLLRPGITTGRGKKEDIIGIVAMYIDIDLKKDDKPRGVEDIHKAVKLIVGHGIDPTLVISTGNGIHGWWVFKEPVMFDNPKDRKEAEQRCQRLQETVRQRAKKHDWDIDSTHDVTRVLRLPGTYNRKDPANPLEVKLILDTGIEYGDPENDFEDHIVGIDQITIRQNLGGIVHVSTDLVLDPMAVPPADRFQDLNEIDPKFGQTYKAQRGKEDTKKWKDTSASSFVLALSNYMAQAGWTDQEMADTIIAFYRENQTNPNIEGTPSVQKALRPDYIERTIGLARASLSEKKIEDYMENIAPLIGSEVEAKLDPNGEKGRTTVNLALGNELEVLSIREEMAEKSAIYIMRVKTLSIYEKGQFVNKWIKRQITFESTAQFYSLKTFEERIFERTQVALRINPKYWKHIIRPNWKKFMNVTPVGEQTIESRMKYWIECYLENRTVQTREEAAEDNSPFVYKGHWHIPADKFNTWASSTGKDQFGVSNAEKDFSAVGAERVRYDLKSQYSGKRKTLRPWKIPISIMLPPPTVVKSKKDPSNDNQKSASHKLATGTKSHTGS